MVASKRKQSTAVDSNNNYPENTSNVTVVSELSGEDSWIIVNKQRINILIPCLPSIEQSMLPDLEQVQLRGNMSSNMTNIPPELPQEKPPKAYFTEENDRSMSWSLKSNSQPCPKTYSPADNAVAIPKPRKPDLRRLTTQEELGALRTFSGKTNSLLKFRATFPELIRPSMQSGLSGVCNLSTSTINLSLKLRALNLERNILDAGGLGRWLSSLGLQHFEGIFRANNLNKFHLASLSMKKLKDMGAHAVGPRRKLIHAIECVCQPYCHEHYIFRIK